MVDSRIGSGSWLVPGATTTLLPFLLMFGATYFFAEFGPNTTTFVYPAERVNLLGRRGVR